jgi:hypothetical protein
MRGCDVGPDCQEEEHRVKRAEWLRSIRRRRSPIESGEFAGIPFVWTDRNSLDVELRKGNLERASNTPLRVCTEGNRAYMNNSSQ